MSAGPTRSFKKELNRYKLQFAYKERLVHMIAREWRCFCPADKIETFIPYLHITGIKDAENTTGYIGAEILQRISGNSFEVVLITYWNSIESISKFAGSDIEKAVLYPDDCKYGITSDPVVKHYSVVEKNFL